LEDWSAGGQQWDIVVLDPPAFAKNLGARPQALRAYRRLNQLGLSVLRSGGLLVTCSCSGPISLEEFQGTVIEAAERANRPLQLTELYTHGLDHPLLPVMSEAGYLKVLFCRA
jgi:23S rRNA (cytosine1962-C5)-methyltransferase